MNHNVFAENPISDDAVAAMQAVARERACARPVGGGIGGKAVPDSSTSLSLSYTHDARVEIVCVVGIMAKPCRRGCCAFLAASSRPVVGGQRPVVGDQS